MSRPVPAIEPIDGMGVFCRYFNVTGRLLNDCVSITAKTTAKKTKQLFASDFYIISSAALRVAAEIRLHQRKIGG
jgi:hypothetical protein